MASNYFRFKQFTVIQNKAAMKVGTDGVLLGSWVDVESVERVLDIGTGTGLIALMIAQRNSTCIVDAIDIDGCACMQAYENCKMSIWGRRLNVFNFDLQRFSNTQTGKYDLIVCNPPFFSNSFASEDKQRNIARHNDTLPFDDLFYCVSRILEVTGRFAIVAPIESEELLISFANGNGLFVNRRMRMMPVPDKSHKRVFMEFGRFKNQEFMEEEIVVEEFGRHRYSKDYIGLTGDFYLQR
ncbi:methyltransferase domain-containing protein [Marinilabiliaceae bacterium JC017]|nr:methyltransferase domain-containing protein [Marinilabiliaceae bacterium JC017]